MLWGGGGGKGISVRGGAIYFERGHFLQKSYHEPVCMCVCVYVCVTVCVCICM